MDLPNELPAGFDPNGPGIRNNLFGLPVAHEQADIIIVPVPWEVTVSYGAGTALAPSAVLRASAQVDLFHRDFPEAWKLKAAMLPVPESLHRENKTLRDLAESHIRSLEDGTISEASSIIPEKINEAGESLNIYVKNTALRWLKNGKLVGVLGGDHSSPLGLLRALAERYERFAILQVDAHADLRKMYEGFLYSHASIMFNALKLPAVGKIVQVGIRDYCEEEVQMLQRAAGRIKTFFDADLKAGWFEGKTWASQCLAIMKELPDHVYISFDIDGLDPKLCPHTGTPVPGGLEWDHIQYLLKQLSKSGKKIIGFDLCEVAGDHEWDANVGARVLWELCHAMAATNKLHGNN
jgi:agmatinase